MSSQRDRWALSLGPVNGNAFAQLRQSIQDLFPLSLLADMSRCSDRSVSVKGDPVGTENYPAALKCVWENLLYTGSLWEDSCSNLYFLVMCQFYRTQLYSGCGVISCRAATHALVDFEFLLCCYF